MPTGRRVRCETKISEGFAEPNSFEKMKKANLHYPERTEGSKHADELRHRANKIGDKQRAELLDRAMQRIYGFRPKAAVGTGH